MAPKRRERSTQPSMHCSQASGIGLKLAFPMPALQRQEPVVAARGRHRQADVRSGSLRPLERPLCNEKLTMADDRAGALLERCRPSQKRSRPRGLATTLPPVTTDANRIGKAAQATQAGAGRARQPGKGYGIVCQTQRCDDQLFGMPRPLLGQPLPSAGATHRRPHRS